MSTSPPETAVATLVASDAVDKLDALAAIARTVGATVHDAGTSHPTVPLAEGVWVVVDIPKFGEPPPLAIDVHAVGGLDVARSSALILLDQLRRSAGWSVIPAFDPES